jgi:NAD(P)H-hydrate repair Nnr-like enzyme with NAD(P)H-hydrate epimerase domain
MSMVCVCRVGALALASVLFGVGCGETVLDEADTEATIEQNVERATDRKVASVDCPSGVEVKKGTTFECVVNFESGKRSVETLKIRNEDADVSVIDFRSER